MSSDPLHGQDFIYPVLQEPSHKTIFHNDKIDIYAVHFASGERTFYHKHTRDQVGIVLRTSRWLDQKPGAPEQERKSFRGTLSFLPHTATGGITHRVIAVDEFWVMAIEFAKPAGPSAQRAAAGLDQTDLEFPQGAVKRVTIEPRASLEIPGSLMVTMSPVRLKDADTGAVWLSPEGSVKWIGDGSARTYVNDSQEPASLVVLSIAG